MPWTVTRTYGYGQEPRVEVFTEADAAMDYWTLQASTLAVGRVEVRDPDGQLIRRATATKRQGQ